MKRVGLALLPAFVLVVGVLGSIFAGVASPTEAASVGAAGGLILTMLKGRFSMEMLRGVMQVTTRITSLGFIILVGANCFGLVFRGLNGDHLVQDFLKGLPFGPYGVLALVMFVIFLLGFFIDYYEICFIHVPILVPVLVEHFGFDPAVARHRHQREPPDVLPHAALRLLPLLPPRGRSRPRCGRSTSTAA